MSKANASRSNFKGVEWVLGLCALAFGFTMLACESDGANVRQGLYTGELVSFEAEDGQLSEFRFTGIECRIPHPANTAVSLCFSRPNGLPDGSLALRGAGFAGMVEDVHVDGLIDGDIASGEWTYSAVCLDGTHCETSGSWDAQYLEVTGGDEETEVELGNTAEDGGSAGTETGQPPDDSDPVQSRPGPPVTEPVVPLSASEIQLLAAECMAEIRGLVGLSVPVQDEGINAAAQAHADYYALHANDYGTYGVSAHDEVPEWEEGFTGITVSARLAYQGVTASSGTHEIMAFSGSVKGSFNGWMDTLYHRIPLVHPNTTSWGYGMAQQGAAAEVIDALYSGTSETGPALWPVPGAVDVDRLWNGYESPQPPLPDGESYPSGPVITATFATSQNPQLSEAWLESADGTVVPCQVQSPENDSWLSTTWAIYSYVPLAPTSTYTVFFEGTVAGAPTTVSWSFTTN
jgi:hypothetical protein